jgi:hypothetical protein
VEGPAGFIHMIEMRDKLLSVFCTASAKIETTRSTMEKYLDSIAGGKAPS